MAVSVAGSSWYTRNSWITWQTRAIGTYTFLQIKGSMLLYDMIVFFLKRTGSVNVVGFL